ncbi:MAG: endonuclease/exonuclease/phosphatase family protein [candidate division WOR-3 bacterium]|nr:endonuclease/exonuclease/phosphatase family protein [candidate division WOR-3 bacterium]MDW8150786.1 endonuclease/exonuclease/phosphatase family protein [candidate division WOR-3 bacterium]
MRKLVFIFLISCSALKLQTIEKESEKLEVYCDENKYVEDTIITIASYNVENLFDDIEDGYEYKDYSKNTSNYSTEFFIKKINNIKKVLTDINPDIVGFQEIENKRALSKLFENIKDLNYKCFVIADKPQFSTVKTALISKYEIIEAIGYKTIPDVRNILFAKISVNGNILYVFVNHWKSKKGPESERIKIAKIHRKIIDSLLKVEPDADIVSIGDFNTHYDDKQSDVIEGNAFNYKPIIGLIDILKTTGNIDSLKYGYLYNLWYDIPKEERGSHYYKGNWGTLDHILISKGLLDTIGISYIKNSFRVFKASYLLDEAGIPYRWQVEFEGDRTIHLGKGFADHLPIYAKFKLRK